MYFTWCLIDKAQLLISSEMNGKHLGKPTLRGQELSMVASFLPAKHPYFCPSLRNRSFSPRVPPLSALPAPLGGPGTHGVQPCAASTIGVLELPAWHRYSAQSRLFALLPNTHRPGRSWRCCWLPREGKGSRSRCRLAPCCLSPAQPRRWVP